MGRDRKKDVSRFTALNRTVFPKMFYSQPHDTFVLRSQFKLLLLIRFLHVFARWGEANKQQKIAYCAFNHAKARIHWSRDAVTSRARSLSGARALSLRRASVPCPVSVRACVCVIERRRERESVCVYMERRDGSFSRRGGRVHRAALADEAAGRPLLR